MSRRPESPEALSESDADADEGSGARQTRGDGPRLSDTRSLRPGSRSRVAATATYDPQARIRALTTRESHLGLSFGFVGALLLHAVAATHGYTSLLDLGAFVDAIGTAVTNDLRSTYAVEMEKKTPIPEVKEEPPPQKPEQVVKAPTAPANAPPQAPPPAPAQAGKLLTAEADPNAPLDLTDEGFVTGEGERFVGGVTASTGTSTIPVRKETAQLGGVPNGTGTRPVAAAPPPAPTEDRSRAPRPLTLNWNDCGFPAEADAEQIDQMRVTVVVTVGLDGRAVNATVLGNPGYGFGPLAQRCAMRKTYSVGLDIAGNPAVRTTPPIGVTFRR